MPKLPLQIILEFDKGVRFEKEVVGKSLDFNIKNYKGKLYFPELVNNDIQKPDALIESLFEDSLPKYCWGKLDYNSIKIKSFLIHFEIVKDENFTETINNLFWIIRKKWFQNLKEHIEICKEISFKKRKQEIKDYVGYAGINAKTIINNKNLKVPIVAPPSPPIITSISEFQFINNEINLALFNYIINIISELKEVPTELSLINKARIELKSNPRRAIIDCSTALEITLTKICKEYLLELHDEGFVNNLLDNKYKTLGNRLHLAFLLNLFDDDGYHEDIVSVRNKIIHKGYSPSQEEAKIAYEKSSNLIKRFSDLEYFN